MKVLRILEIVLLVAATSCALAIMYTLTAWVCFGIIEAAMLR